MLEIIALSIFFAVMAALGFYFIRETVRNQKVLQSVARVADVPPRKPRPAPGNPNKYHAVSIVRSLEACAPSVHLSGKRFLSSEAPALPLPGCAVRSCRCRYVHHADRRADDRRFPFGVRKHVESAVASERRRGDRRKASDLAFG